MYIYIYIYFFFFLKYIYIYIYIRAHTTFFYRIAGSLLSNWNRKNAIRKLIPRALNEIRKLIPRALTLPKTFCQARRVSGLRVLKLFMVPPSPSCQARNKTRPQVPIKRKRAPLLHWALPSLISFSKKSHFFSSFHPKRAVWGRELKPKLQAKTGMVHPYPRGRRNKGSHNLLLPHSRIIVKLK